MIIRYMMFWIGNPRIQKQLKCRFSHLEHDENLRRSAIKKAEKA